MKFKKTLLTITAAAGMMTAGSLAANADTVTVKSGDTISSIAKENNISVSAIEKANDIANINMIYVGQQIEIGENGQVTQAQPQASVAQAPAQPAQPQNQQKAQPAQPKAKAPVQQKAQPQQVQQKAQPQQTTQVQSQPKAQPAVQQSAPKQAAATSNSGSSSEEAAKAAIANRESGGSYSATNGQYYGKYQLGKSMLNGDLSEANQEKTADNYVSDRYGSWSNALDHSDQYGWY